jgi:hypothetical protein
MNTLLAAADRIVLTRMMPVEAIATTNRGIVPRLRGFVPARKLLLCVASSPIYVAPLLLSSTCGVSPGQQSEGWAS